MTCRSHATVLLLASVVTVADACRPRNAAPGAPGDARATTPPQIGATGADTDAGAIARQLDLVRRRPQDVRARVDLARLWVQDARDRDDPAGYVHAAEAVDRARALAPGDPAVRAMDAMLMLQNRRFRDARRVAQSLVDGAQAADAFGILSDAAQELGDYGAAVDAAQRAVDARPDEDSYARAAWLRWVHGDAEGAVNVMRLAVEAGTTSSTHARAWVATQMARLYWNAGDLVHAGEYFDRALREDPGFADAHVGRARVLVATGRAADAVTAAEAALRRGPSVERAWAAADAHIAAEHRSDAAADEALAERIGPSTDPRALSLLLSTRGRNPDLALDLARREHENRADVFTDDALAWALYRAGRFADAAESVARARRTGIRDARILYHAGRIAQALGRRDEATEALRGALSANPHWDPIEPDEARAALRALGAAPATDTPTDAAP